MARRGENGRLRVVYVHQYFDTREAAGGTRSYEFARRLVRDGFDVHMVTSDRSEEAEPVWTHRVVDGIKVHSVGVPYSQDMSPSRRIRSFFSFALKSSVLVRRLRGDVVYATSTPLTVAVPAIYATALRNTPYVLEVRDLWPEMPIAIGALRGRLPKTAARFLEQIAYMRAAEVVALSPGMVEGVLAVSPRKRVTMIPNSSDLDLFVSAPDGTGWRNSVEGLGDRPFALYAGSIGKVNSLRYLVDVAAELGMLDPQLAIVIMGRGSDSDVVAAYAQKRGVLGANLFMPPPVPKAQVASVYREAAVALSWFLPLPEMEANSANKFFDGLAAGKPMAINYGGWMAELLEENDAGVRVDSQDAAKAASSLAKLMTHEERLGRTGANARKLAEAEFGREDLVQKLEDVLLRVGLEKLEQESS